MTRHGHVPRSTGCLQEQESLRWDLPSSLSRDRSHAGTSALVPRGQLRTAYLQGCKIINVGYFKALNLWSFLQQ